MSVTGDDAGPLLLVKGLVALSLFVVLVSMEVVGGGEAGDGDGWLVVSQYSDGGPLHFCAGCVVVVFVVCVVGVGVRDEGNCSPFA